MVLGGSLGVQMADNKATGLAVNEVSNISRWYDNRSIFITGATGFMGKVLVEKLLNSCPGINKIYLLLRSKREVSPEKRLEQLKQTPIFDYIKKYYPQRMDKLVVISGDIIEPELKISKEDQKLLCSNVSVVFHSAATVKFDEAINLSVAMNMMGTRWLIQLCQKMPKLEALVHVSTAYCNCDLSYVEEKIYPPPNDITKTIKYMECLDNDILAEMTPRIIGNRPNTYTFTKAMAENILLNESGDLPVVLIRPSIVTASLQSPMPGWIDNLNGPTGLIAGGGKGLLRTLHCDVKKQTDIIPVDICINAMIISAWSTAKKKNAPLTVYHVTTGMLNPLTWGILEQLSLKNFRLHPFNDVLWYPGGSFKTNKLYHSICHGLFHIFPAYIIDYSYIILGKKPPISMVKVQQKIQTAIKAINYFIKNEWTFASGNIVKMQTMLSEADKKIFDIDTTKIQWEPYIENYVKGVRKYVLKEDDKDLPKARQHMKKMYIIHCITKVLFIMAMLRFIIGNLYIMRKFGFGIITYAFQLITRIISLPIK